MSELLIGAGHRRKKFMPIGSTWSELTTLDINPLCKPDVVHDLNDLPYPFGNEQFDEIHAYEVLEHCGTQGDFKFFFGQFDEFYRILKPNGIIYGSVPTWNSRWAFADPGHTRIITPDTLSFLSQDMYVINQEQPTSDYREWYDSNFKLIFNKTEGATYIFGLRKIGHLKEIII